LLDLGLKQNRCLRKICPYRTIGKGAGKFKTDYPCRSDSGDGAKTQMPFTGNIPVRNQQPKN
jgi:hypothetical protein